MIIKTNDNNLLIDIFNRDGNVVLKIKYGNFISESFILLGSIHQLHGFTNAMVNNPEHMKEINKSESEKMQPFIDYTVEQFTDDLGHSPKGAGFSIPSDCTANLFNNLRKMLNYVQSMQNEVENIRTNYEYQKQGYDKALSELEKSKQEQKEQSDLLQRALVKISDNGLTISELKSENEALKHDRKVAEEYYEQSKTNLEKLKLENENYLAALGVYDEVLNLIPNVFDNDLVFNRKVAIDFIKSALVEKRIAGKWYVAKYDVEKYTNKQPQACFYIGDKAWFVAGISNPVPESKLSDISLTPLDLGE